MHTYSDIFAMSYITLIWLVIWMSSHVQDLKLSERARAAGTPHVSLPNDKRLMFFSGALILFFILFYMSLYAGIGNDGHMSGYLYSANPHMIQLTAAVAIFSGMLLVIKSRKGLRDLTTREVVFSINAKKENQVRAGAYSCARHPMYLGMLTIAAFSLALFPSIAGAGFLSGIIFCILMKIRIESSSLL